MEHSEPYYWLNDLLHYMSWDGDYILNIPAEGEQPHRFYVAYLAWIADGNIPTYSYEG